MRFEDDTDPATTLVRTPPSHAGERLTYEVSDGRVDDAVAKVREVLGPDEKPVVGPIDAIAVETVEDGMRQYAEENPGQDPLADYATTLAMQAHEQKTGERIDESGRYDLDENVRDEFLDGEEQPVDEHGNAIPTPPEQPTPKKATASKKAAAREHAAAKD